MPLRLRLTSPCWWKALSPFHIPNSAVAGLKSPLVRRGVGPRGRLARRFSGRLVACPRRVTRDPVQTLKELPQARRLVIEGERLSGEPEINPRGELALAHSLPATQNKNPAPKASRA